MRKLRLMGLSVILLIMPLALAACSKSTNTHWRKSHPDRIFQINVRVPTFSPDPAIGQNNRDGGDFMEAVMYAIEQWDAHPDLEVNLSDAGCESHNTTPAAPNCLYAFRVTQAYMDTIYPSLPPGSAIGSAVWWQNSEHIFNSGADPNHLSFTRFLVSDHIYTNGDGVLSTLEKNVTCHELGHTLGLNHADPYDSDGNGTPDTQPSGPCVDGVPDRSSGYNSASGTGTAGYDFDNIEIEYDTCHADGAGNPPAGGFGGDDPCGLSAQSFGVDEDPEPFDGESAPRKQVHVDTEESLDD